MIASVAMLLREHFVGDTFPKEKLPYIVLEGDSSGETICIRIVELELASVGLWPWFLEYIEVHCHV